MLRTLDRGTYPNPHLLPPLLPHTPTSIQCASLSRENRLKSRAEERLVYGDRFPFPVPIPFDHHVRLASHCSGESFCTPQQGFGQIILYIFPTSLFPCVRVSPCSNFPTSVILIDVFATTLRIFFCLCTFNYLLPSSSGPCHLSNPSTTPPITQPNFPWTQVVQIARWIVGSR